MRTLTYTELMKITGNTPKMMKAKRHRKLLALAWGLQSAFKGMNFVEIDAVGMLLVELLGRYYPLKYAAQLVRCHCDEWARAVAIAEAIPQRDAYFCIIDMRREMDGKAVHLTCSANDIMPHQIAAEVQKAPQAQGASVTGISCVNVSDAIKKIRSSGKAAGVDLSGPFLPPPDSQEFATLFQPYVERRDAAQKTVNEQRARETLARVAGNQARAAAEALLAIVDSTEHLEAGRK
jgi:hypothetical protein